MPRNPFTFWRPLDHDYRRNRCSSMSSVISVGCQSKSPRKKSGSPLANQIATSERIGSTPLGALHHYPNPPGLPSRIFRAYATPTALNVPPPFHRSCRARFTCFFAILSVYDGKFAPRDSVLTKTGVVTPLLRGACARCRLHPIAPEATRSVVPMSGTGL